MATTPVPAFIAPPDFPALSDRATGTYNSKAFAWATAMQSTTGPNIQAIAVTAKANADDAAASAVTASGFVTTVAGSASSAAQSVADAAAQASIAQGAANNKGNWSALTGALNMPASVVHAGKIWVLRVNLANVTLSQPGTNSDWISASGGALQYALVSAAGGSVPSATGYCTVEITAPTDSYVLLPDATTLTKGFAYEMKVTNQVYLTPFAAANPLGTQFTSGVWRLFLLDNTTPTGTWAYTPVIATTGAGVGTVQGATVTIAATDNAPAPQPVVMALDAARTLVIYHTQGAASGTAGVWAVVLSCPDVSASKAPAIAVGTPVLISGTNNGTNATYANTVQCVAVGTELFAVAWNSAASAATDSAPVVVMVSTSGMTVTAGAVSALHASESQTYYDSGVRICSPAANTFAVAYVSATASSVYARVGTVSGTTITLGAETTVASGLGYTAGQIRYVGIVAHTSNTVVIGYSNVTATFGKLVAATFSGTTLTFGTAVNSGQATGGYYVNELVHLSATSGWCKNAGYSTVYTLSGTTITVGTEVAALGDCKTIAISATKVFQIAQGNGATSKHFAVSGTTISAGSPATLTTTLSSATPKTRYFVNGNALYIVSGSETMIIDIPTFTLRTSLNAYAITGGGRYRLGLIAFANAAFTAQASQYPTTTILN